MSEVPVKNPLDEVGYLFGSAPTFDLHIADRIFLLDILPREGNIITLKIIRDLRDGLGLSEEDISKSGVTFKDGMWGIPRYALDIVKPIPMGEKAQEVVRSALEAVSAKGKLGIDQIDLYERFVGEITDDEP